MLRRGGGSSRWIPLCALSVTVSVFEVLQELIAGGYQPDLEHLSLVLHRTYKAQLPAWLALSLPASECFVLLSLLFYFYYTTPSSTSSTPIHVNTTDATD